MVPENKDDTYFEVEMPTLVDGQVELVKVKVARPFETIDEANEVDENDDDCFN